MTIKIENLDLPQVLEIAIKQMLRQAKQDWGDEWIDIEEDLKSIIRQELLDIIDSILHS